MTLKVEVRRFSDGRLMLVVHLAKGSNLWMHDNGTCSYVPKKSEIELIKDSFDAIVTFNMLRNSLKLSNEK